MNIREIRPGDNSALREIIKKVMTEFNADPKTTVLGDPSINTMFENYQEPRAAYYVVEDNGTIFGGCGIRQLDGGPKNICELQRMFLLPEARGKGFGKKLIDLCISKAKEFSYTRIYLESLGQMDSAIALYEKSGFKKIPKSLGNTGHGGCDVFMVLDI